MPEGFIATEGRAAAIPSGAGAIAGVADRFTNCVPRAPDCVGRRPDADGGFGCAGYVFPYTFSNR